jgi:hypothetical protein
MFSSSPWRHCNFVSSVTQKTTLFTLQFSRDARTTAVGIIHDQLKAIEVRSSGTFENLTMYLLLGTSEQELDLANAEL